MVDNLLSDYHCPFCKNKDISEKQIDIVGAAGNTVNIDIHCPACKKHFMAKTEVMQVELWSITADKLGQIHKSLSALKGKLGGNIEIEADIISDGAEKKILDKNIVDLRKWMSGKGFTVEDLLGDS